uniref:Uncharacterized protein n=1 Tax=Timema genevievae TaxID=629358 RepID=A0A7R9JS89_TIMGE|nr:unnamed protein product [Timema genevievae]
MIHQVCKQFNNICKKRLNKGFILAEKFENKCLKSMKSQLPRRESERRNHPLARHCDILSAIETRISMMSMTFNKYIETDLSCFIPGKRLEVSKRYEVLIWNQNFPENSGNVSKLTIISESAVKFSKRWGKLAPSSLSDFASAVCVLHRRSQIESVVLRIIQNKEFPPKTHEILQELRDLSSMAMEHFDEKIAPNLKFRLPCAKFRAQLQLVTDSKQSLCEVSPITNDKLNRNKQRDTISAEHEKEIIELKAQMVQLKKVISDMSNGVKTPGEPESTRAILNDSKEEALPKKRALTEYYNTRGSKKRKCGLYKGFMIKATTNGMWRLAGWAVEGTGCKEDTARETMEEMGGTDSIKCASEGRRVGEEEWWKDRRRWKHFTKWTQQQAGSDDPRHESWVIQGMLTEFLTDLGTVLLLFGGQKPGYKLGGNAVHLNSDLYTILDGHKHTLAKDQSVTQKFVVCFIVRGTDSTAYFNVLV